MSWQWDKAVLHGLEYPDSFALNFGLDQRMERVVRAELHVKAKLAREYIFKCDQFHKQSFPGIGRPTHLARVSVGDRTALSLPRLLHRLRPRTPHPPHSPRSPGPPRSHRPVTGASQRRALKAHLADFQPPACMMASASKPSGHHISRCSDLDLVRLPGCAYLIFHEKS